MTAHARSGDFIIEDANDINRDEEHRPVEEGPRDLVTVLLLKCVSGTYVHLGANDGEGEKR